MEITFSSALVPQKILEKSSDYSKATLLVEDEAVPESALQFPSPRREDKLQLCFSSIAMLPREK